MIPAINAIGGGMQLLQQKPNEGVPGKTADSFRNKLALLWFSMNDSEFSEEPIERQENTDADFFGKNVAKDKAAFRRTIVDTMENPQEFLLSKIGADSPLEKIQNLNNLRNTTILQGVDIMYELMKQKRYIQDHSSNTPRYGKEMVLEYGGLQYPLSIQELQELCKEKFFVLQDKNDEILGSYIYATDLSNSLNSKTVIEQITLGESMGKLLSCSLKTRNNFETSLKQEAIQCLEENSLGYLFNLFAHRQHRRQGISSYLKEKTFEHLLLKGKKKGILKIFTIKGIFKGKDENSLVPICKFDSPIKNKGSLELNNSIIRHMGYIPFFRKISEMDTSPENKLVTESLISNFFNKEGKEPSNLWVYIENEVFLTDLKEARNALYSKRKLKNR